TWMVANTPRRKGKARPNPSVRTSVAIEPQRLCLLRSAKACFRSEQFVPWRLWLVPVGVAIFTFVIFSPALRAGFVWDDDPNILQNPQYRGLGWAQLRWMFTNLSMGHYQPLGWLTLGLDYVLWGM